MSWLPGLIAMLGAGAAAPAPGAGPSAAPSGFSVQQYGSPSKVRARWTNGDASAYTIIYKRETNCAGAELGQVGAANPGATSFDLAETWDPQAGYYAKHSKNGQESAASNCAQSGTLQ